MSSIINVPLSVNTHAIILKVLNSKKKRIADQHHYAKVLNVLRIEICGGLVVDVVLCLFMCAYTVCRCAPRCVCVCVCICVCVWWWCCCGVLLCCAHMWALALLTQIATKSFPPSPFDRVLLIFVLYKSKGISHESQ